MPFEFGPLDRILLNEVEVKVTVDGEDAKEFCRADGTGLPETLSNEEIAKALDTDEMIVQRGFYHSDRQRINRSGELASNLPEEQRAKIGFKLTWVILIRGLRERVGGIPHERREAVMLQLQAEYAADFRALRRKAHFRNFNFTYEHKQVEAPPSLTLVSYETASRWSLKLARAAEDAMVLKDGRGAADRESTFTAEELHIQGRFVWRYMSMTKPNIAYLFRIMKAVERRINRSRPKATKLELGCKSTFYNRIDALPDFAKYLAHEGDAKAMAKYAIVIGKNRGHPMDLAEGDECRLDLVTMIENAKVWDLLTKEEQEAYRKASNRFWCSAVVDHATTSFLSFRLHRTAPSVRTARAAFELTTIDKTHIARAAGCKFDWPQHGGLRASRLDAAAWYTADAMKLTLSDAGVNDFRPPLKAPWLRGTMEHIFLIIGQLTYQNFSGRTFSNIVVRGDRDPRSEASVDPVLLERVLLRAIVDIFHNSRNTGKLGGMTPMQAWMTGCKDKKPPPAPTGYLRRHIYGLNFTRVIGREGIEFLGFFYQSDEIQEMRRDRTGVEVHIRVDLQDLGEITVYHGRLVYRVEARVKRLKGISYWKATAALQELRVIDTEYTDRTIEQVDEALEYVDSQAELARLTYSIASPIITEKHIKYVEDRIRRPIRVVKETRFTREIAAQDWSGTPFTDEAFGYADPPEDDDLDLGSEQTPEATEAKYGAPKSKSKKKPKQQAESDPIPTQATTPEEPNEPLSARYFEEY